ncbi:hypothetical protein [Streptomyces sp. LaBMicrA B280]|uniref:hypothetical protein n=1 Tax=Streptomyces sp. LaBMicrA B280 TaxID=3391001 RepID=UPI003BA6F80D
MVISGAGELKGLKVLKDVEEIAEATPLKKFVGVTADASMPDELAAKGVKFSREDVIATARRRIRSSGLHHEGPY